MSDRKELLRYFSTADVDRCRQQGYSDRQILALTEHLLLNCGATESTVRDMFFEEYDVPLYNYQARKATEFGDRKTIYVWYPRIVRQEVNLMMCAGGTGKTYCVCLIAADVSRGRTLPGDYKPQSGGETCLIISGEDTGELLKERLKACNADLNKIYILDCHDSTGLNFGVRWEEFQSIVEQYRPAMTVIDPLQSFIGEEADLNKVNVIRPIMQRLANIAKAANTAILLISHVNKKSQTDNLNNAASGSTDFVNASRSAMYIIFDEQDQNSRLLIHSKSNYAPAAKTVRFTFDDRGGIFWNGFSDIDRFTVEEAARKRKTPGEVVRSNAYQAEANDLLLRALLDAAKSGEITRFSYDGFKERYGSDIFGTQQPKRALDNVAEAMSSRGWKLETGKNVKQNDTSVRGFFISPVNQAEEQISIYS